MRMLDILLVQSSRASPKGARSISLAKLVAVAAAGVPLIGVGIYLRRWRCGGSDDRSAQLGGGP